jgi:uncharacterized protein (UPF0332 family)/predicted nucleotidyltransferase
MNVRMTRSDVVADPNEVRILVDRFSHEIKKELGSLVKSVVWFGSAVKPRSLEGKRILRDEILYGSDIDILIVFDDTTHFVTPEVITAYRIITEKTAFNVSARLHITTMALTKFWDYSLNGDPIMINILRDGIILLDDGCFGMAQKLLGSKKIEPTKSAVWIYLGRGPQSINNANWNACQAVLDLYWAVFDAAHAALLYHNVVPETPDYLVPLFQEHIINTNILPRKYLTVLGEFMNAGKMIMKGEITKMNGDSYDRYRTEAWEFVHIIQKAMMNNK